MALFEAAFARGNETGRTSVDSLIGLFKVASVWGNETTPDGEKRKYMSLHYGGQPRPRGFSE